MRFCDADIAVGFRGQHADRRRIEKERIQRQGVVDDNLEGVNNGAASRSGVAGHRGLHSVGAGSGGSATYRDRVDSSIRAVHTVRHTRQGQRSIGIVDLYIRDGVTQIDNLCGIGRHRHRGQRDYIQLHLLVGKNGITIFNGDGIFEEYGGWNREIGVRVGEGLMCGGVYPVPGLSCIGGGVPHVIVIRTGKQRNTGCRHRVAHT